MRLFSLAARRQPLRRHDSGKAVFIPPTITTPVSFASGVISSKSPSPRYRSAALFVIGDDGGEDAGRFVAVERPHRFLAGVAVLPVRK